jgi:putative hydrolase of the HAD superfamily
VLFDLDDTLCDYAASREARLRRAFSLARRLAADPRRLDAMVEQSVSMEPHGADHFPRLFEAHGVDGTTSAAAASRWYRRNRFFGLRLHADARETLLEVRRNRDEDGTSSRRTVGLVTNGPAEVQRDKIAMLGLEELIDFAVVSGELGVWKPDPAIFRAALRLGGSDAEDAVFVGDSPEYDIAGAQAAGMRSVWMDRGGSGWNPALPPPDRTVVALREVPPLLAAPRRAAPRAV